MKNKRKMKLLLFGGHATRRCCFCRRPLTLGIATLDHVVPLSKGGGSSRGNLRISCGPCNNDRGDQNFEEYRKKQQSLRERCLAR
jgi:5-methylcytosine-specific restriction endonuclease McrA